MKIVSCHTVDSKPVKQEVSGTMILPRLVFPVITHVQTLVYRMKPGASFQLLMWLHVSHALM